MYKKLFFVSVILTSFSVFAATGKGYREFGEAYYSAPNANFHVEEVSIGTAHAVTQDNAMSAKTTTRVPNRVGRVNESVTVDGYHEFTITNNTSLTQIYEIYIDLECDNMHSYYIRHVELKPGGYYTREDHTYGTVQVIAPGGYRISGKSKLNGESSDSSQNSGTLYVAM